GDGTLDARNVYNADGIRVAQTVNGEETRFLIDTVQPNAQVVVEYRPSGLITASYVYGSRLLSQNRGGVTSFYHVDGLGSTRALTDGTGLVTARYLYDAFGRTLAQSGAVVNAYLFAGQQRDAALGLDYLRARYYDPLLRRFTAAAPLWGRVHDPRSIQAYGYGMNNPVNGTDPSGREFSLLQFTVTSAILGALVGGAHNAIAGKSIIDGIVDGFIFGLAAGLAIGAGGMALGAVTGIGATAGVF